MAFQVGGEPPFDTQVGANAMMSNASFKGCPSWDQGCSTNPLSNLNAVTTLPGTPQDKTVAPGNTGWSSNTYSGPWGWYAYLYGTCGPLPTDPSTKKALTSHACGVMGYAAWSSTWQQDASSANGA